MLQRSRLKASGSRLVVVGQEGRREDARRHDGVGDGGVVPFQASVHLLVVGQKSRPLTAWKVP